MKYWRQAMVHVEEFFWGHANYILKIPTDCWFLNYDRHLMKSHGVLSYHRERIPFIGIYTNKTWDGKDPLYTPKELTEMKEAILFILEEETRFGWVTRLPDGRCKQRRADQPSAHASNYAKGSGNNMTKMVKEGRQTELNENNKS